MALRVLSMVFALLALIYSVSAQIGPDPNWKTPDGSKADFSSTFVAGGDTITIAWKALDNSVADLYLTHWDPTTFTWHYQVASNIDISKAGSLRWYIDVPASNIQNDNKYVLRFYPRGVAYSAKQFPQKASPGFYLKGGTQSTTTTTPPPVGGGAGDGTTSAPPTPTPSPQESPTETSFSDPATQTSSSDTAIAESDLASSTSTSESATMGMTTDAYGRIITATVTTSSPSQTDVAGSSQTSSSSSSSSGGLSLGAQAGIGVAGGLAVVMLFIAGCFFGRRVGLGRMARRNDPSLDRDGIIMTQNSAISAMSGVSYMSNGTAISEVSASGPLVGKRPQTANDSDEATLVAREKYEKYEKYETYDEHNRKWYKSRTPWVEVPGNTTFPIEKDGSMVRPGLHEVG